MLLMFSSEVGQQHKHVCDINTTKEEGYTQNMSLSDDVRQWEDTPPAPCPTSKRYVQQVLEGHGEEGKGGGEGVAVLV